ncbi:hypothetical protein MKQ68_23235 [Chitinophaga horti]|uniref:Uncharacterized protein n=1 Tax=Chitinophaga horti TaxID=2920382 RepID=A0ABY6J0C8_9BACT|nr:hypothetical protein [Chitinophaga horti]UYQ92998.1 hypothetical protein MKQ68_23235 [Chitinophaga horti]
MQAKKISSSNLLQDTHTRLLNLARSFREAICEECGWSEATFYRKAKGKNTFSNAEKEKIVSVLEILLKAAAEQQEKYRAR